MTIKWKNHSGKCTVGVEEWARIIGEDPLDTVRLKVDADKTTKKSTYKVGYGKPPKDHQFKPGQSGNPKGRPKGKSTLESERDLRGVFWEAAMTPVKTKVHGKDAIVPAIEAMYLQLFSNGVKGHMPSIRLADRLARTTMKEHEDWQVRHYSLVQEHILELNDNPDDVRDPEVTRLLKEAVSRINASITDSS